MTSVGPAPAINYGTKLSLLLFVLLVGAGLALPEINAYQQCVQVEALLLDDQLVQASGKLDAALLRSRDHGRLCYLKAVLERRLGNEQAYQQWRQRAAQSGIPAAQLELQDSLLSVQQGNINRELESQLLAQADQQKSDQVAAETFEAISKGYLSSYRLKEAWKCMEYWVAWRPAAISARMMRGEILIRTGIPAQAVTEYREVLKVDPRHEAASERLANTLLKLNEVEEATKLLEQATQLNPNHAPTWIDLGEAQRRSGDLEKSAQSVRSALKLGVDTRQRGQCSSILGQLALAEQRPQQAVELLLVATELIPEDATAHQALGSALALTDQPEAGAQHRAIAQKIRESYEQVQTWTRKVIDSPDDPQLRVDIGQALWEQGLRREGIAWIKTALVCQPEFEPAKTLLAKLSPGDAQAPVP